MRREIQGGVFAGIAVIGITAIYWVAIGPPNLNGDSVHAMVWGRELADGLTPQYRLGPTPHPLSNLLGVALAALPPDAAYSISEVLAYVFVACLLVAVWRLGAALVNEATGVGGAVIVALQPGLLARISSGFYDIPALALAVTALTVAIRTPERRRLVVGLLGLAGLIRPEYWLFGAIYAAVLVGRERRGVPPALVACCFAAPALWTLSDLIVTGDPLFSLTHTQDLASELGRQTGVANVPAAITDNLRSLLTTWTIAAAAVGTVSAMVLRSRRCALLLVAVGIVGLVVYVAIGVANLSLIDRYLLPSSIAACLLAGAALSLLLEHRAARVVGAVVILALLVSLPSTASALRDRRHLVREDHRIVAELRRLAPTMSRCARVDGNPARGIAIPTVAQVLGKPHADVRPSGPADGFFAPTSRSTIQQLDHNLADTASTRLPRKATTRGTWWQAVGCG